MAGPTRRLKGSAPLLRPNVAHSGPESPDNDKQGASQRLLPLCGGVWP